MDQVELADRFDRERPRLRSVAYRIVGSRGEADDAVQEAWLRLQRSDADEIENLEAWLTTVTARICLNIVRDRKTHESIDAFQHEPIIATDATHRPRAGGAAGRRGRRGPAGGIDSLNPPERLAFVLHDMFAVPFDEIAELLERTPEATRQLASRARRRVSGAAPRARPRPRPPAFGRRRLLRRRPRGRPRRAGRRPGPRRPAARPHPRGHAGDPRRAEPRPQRDGRPSSRHVRPAGADQRHRRGGRLRWRRRVRDPRLHHRRRPRGDARHLQRPRAGSAVAAS